MKSKSCTCNGCKERKRLVRLFNKLNKDDVKFLEHMYEDKVHAEMDRAYYKALLSGTWPESKVINEAYNKWREERFKGLK